MLQDLAPYFPYKVRVLVLRDHAGRVVEEVREVSGLMEETLGYRSLGPGIRVAGLTFYKDVKPILRPLSDLSKEIEVGGEKFTPLYRLSSEFDIYLYSDLDVELETDDMPVSVYYSLIKSDRILKRLLEWHFDVYGLIKRHLAIDINIMEELQKWKELNVIL